ncbi:hypothetical protein ACWERW_40135 [Streptomyces sp. NPDC004012]
MAEQREARFWRYEGDFGVSRLTEALQSAASGHVPLDEEAALHLVSVEAARDDDDALALREDAQLLLDSPLPDEALRAVWRAATRGSHDPGPHHARAWLRAITDVCDDELSRLPPSGEQLGYGSAPVVVVDEGAMREAALTEVRALWVQLAQADVASVLERVVTEVDADLGFRLFLRVAKAAAVQVTLERYDRYQQIGEAFGYPGRLVHHGLDVLWPRFDDFSARRRFEGDIGFSFLAGRFHSDLWEHSYSVDEGIRGATGDYGGAVPGSHAYVLLQDSQRLFGSPLSDATLTALWRVVTCRGYDPGASGVGMRQWLRRVVEVCADRLREIDPGFMVGAPGPASAEQTDRVLQELRQSAPALTNSIHNSPWYGASTSPWFELSGVAVPALEQVVTQVDPDLGFRLLLGLLRAYSVPVSEERYARYVDLGERLGYGRYPVLELQDLVLPERPCRDRRHGGEGEGSLW